MHRKTCTQGDQDNISLHKARADMDELQESVEAKLSKAASSSSRTSTQPPPPHPGQQQVSEPVKMCLSSIRKAHSGFDVAIRQWSGTVDRSREHPNTSGTKFEKDLMDFTEAANKIDLDMMGAERNFMVTGALTASEIRAAASKSVELSDLVKSGNKRMNALKSWFLQ